MKNYFSKNQELFIAPISVMLLIITYVIEKSWCIDYIRHVNHVMFYGTIAGLPLGIHGLTAKKDKMLSIANIILGATITLIPIFVLILLITAIGLIEGQDSKFLEILANLIDVISHLVDGGV